MPVPCRRSCCKPALGAQVQHHCTGTLWSIPWCLSCGGRGLSSDFGTATPTGGFGEPQPTAWLCFPPSNPWTCTLLYSRARSFLLLHKELAASISSLCTMGAITNRAVMFSIACLTLYARRALARAWICNSMAWEMLARGRSLVKDPSQSDAFSSTILKISAQTNFCASDGALP